MKASSCFPRLPARLLAAPVRSHRQATQGTSGCQQADSSLRERVLRDIRHLGITPRRALGQNFVTSEKVIDNIVASAVLQQGDAVVEVGPGLGSLTDALLSAGASVLAIEKDDALHGHLRQKYEAEEAVTLLHDDVLSIRGLPGVLDTFRVASAGQGRLKIVANIPYNITTDLLKKLLPLRTTINSVHLLLEEGAARRLTEAQVGDKEYRAVSVFVRYYADARYCFGVSRDMFHPRPHVDSALAEFVLRSPMADFDDSQEAQFLAFITQAFGMKRKTLMNNLKGTCDQRAVQECMQHCGIPIMSRAEALCIQQLIDLFTCVASCAPSAL